MPGKWKRGRGHVHAPGPVFRIPQQGVVAMVVLDRFSRAVQGLDMRHGSVGKRESVVVQLHNRCGGKLHEMAPTRQPVTVTVRLLEDGEGHNVRPVVAAAAFVKPRKASCHCLNHARTGQSEAYPHRLASAP